jgi:hypothetical protein
MTFDYSDDVIYVIVVFDNAKLRVRFKTLTLKGVKN